MNNTALASIPVGVVVERIKGENRWSDFLWRPVSILTGVPDTPLWSKIEGDEERARFYAGAAQIELHRTETPNYRENLSTEAPLLWVILRPTGGDPPYAVALVTADPAEGEAMTLVGEDIIDSVPMPDVIAEAISAFVAEHHVEREFSKRNRDRANPEVFARRTGKDSA